MNKQQRVEESQARHGQPTRRDPRKIADVLTDLFAQRGYAQVGASQDCQQAWARIIGDLAKFTHATEVRRGVLQVIVSNSVVMQELTFRKQDLITELGRALPHHQIKDLRFRLGHLP